MNEETIRSVPIHRALNRPSLYQFWGCDREMVMMAGLMAGVMVFIGMSLFCLVFGVMFWGFSIFALRLMAKADPQLRHVYLRHRQYRPYYPARSTPFVRHGAALLRRLKNPWER